MCVITHFSKLDRRQRLGIPVVVVIACLWIAFIQMASRDATKKMI